MNQFEIKQNYPLSFEVLKKWFNQNFFEEFHASPPAHQLGYLWMFFNHKRINLALNTETSQELKLCNEIKIKNCFLELENRLKIGYKTPHIKQYIEKPLNKIHTA